MSQSYTDLLLYIQMVSPQRRGLPLQRQARSTINNTSGSNEQHNHQQLTSLRPSRPVKDVFEKLLDQSFPFFNQKFCEMICFIWFSDCCFSRSGRPPLQFDVPSNLIAVMWRLLTKGMSRRVMIYSLQFIQRLKMACRQIPPHELCPPQSVVPIAVGALVLACKNLSE